MTYHVTALSLTIYFNHEGDHDHNGLLFALSDNVPVLHYLETRSKDIPPANLEALYKGALPRAATLGIVLPPPHPPHHPDALKAIQDARVHPLVRPLVLRCNLGDTVTVVLKNSIQDRWVGLHLVGDGYAIVTDDGSQVGGNDHSLVKYGDSKSYKWQCDHEGVFPFHDGGNYSGGEDGTNVHGLFGALIVEPAGTIWRDSVTGQTSAGGNRLDGLYLDILPTGPNLTLEQESIDYTPGHDYGKPEEYIHFATRPHREFVIFFHDEPEYLPPHGEGAQDPCEEKGDQGGHGGHGDFLPIMPVSYRAEPMINRERKIWELLKKDPHHFGDRPVLNEEQHHSSWMFGDPATPILKAYIGDPVRIRFVHAAVKETHVFHLHMYEWHAVPNDPESPRIDAISVSPQTAHTIEPLWGAGNRHQVAGDVIWHCHLYPHFHEGMWGIFRTFETLQNGPTTEMVAYVEEEGDIYQDRFIGRYPDGTPIERLLPLPDPHRKPPPRPTPQHPGYPLYIPGKMQQKSPIPPWPDRDWHLGEKEYCGLPSLKADAMPRAFDYRPRPHSLERKAFNDRPLPGELFTRNPFRIQQEVQWEEPLYQYNEGKKEVCHDVIMEKLEIEYNEYGRDKEHKYGWHDKNGHLYYLKQDGHPGDRQKEPLFFRALHGQILNLTFENRTPYNPHDEEPDIRKTEFDPPFPPCAKRNWQGECAMHVHMVKFDPICGDGASTGWNYISGPIAHKKMIYRWWADKEFGTIFFHDHLFANYRQKHGLFGALIVEPIGSKFYHPKENKQIISGLQARIQTLRPSPDKADYVGIPQINWAREFCIAIGDFIPMWKRGKPLNPPPNPGGHGDQGVMALNYRCDPIAERAKFKDPDDEEHRRLMDPSQWFSSAKPYQDPYTTLFLSYEDDPIWFRVLQGSHEEQHSFQVHGLRWQRFRGNPSRNSPMRNQQTFGISEAFTFVNHEKYGAGDYMYKLSAADDLWLGCWGIIRALPKNLPPAEAEGLLHLSETGSPAAERAEQPSPAAVTNGDETRDPYAYSLVPPGKPIRHFLVSVYREKITYRKPDLIDPYGLVYSLDAIIGPDGKECPIHPMDIREPLVLRCREGEWVRVTLKNKIPKNTRLKPEPHAPEVPVEETNPFSHRPERPVSSSVSMHADVLKYDVRTSDGANVGRNKGRGGKGQTVAPEQTYYYEWDTERDDLTSNEGKPLGPVLLQDMADFRNHRHHGLIGALIIEHPDATPYFVSPGKSTAEGHTSGEEAWHGTRVTLISLGDTPTEKDQVEEAVLLIQDGLRLFLRGNIHMPISDEPSAHGEDDVDHEDQGQKGFNYRTEPVGPLTDPGYNPDVAPPADWLANPEPSTPVFMIKKGHKVRLHLLGAQDKPRNQSFTIHGVTWPEWRYLSEDKQNFVASESAITTGTSRTFEFTPMYEGDYAYRSGVLKWAVPQGLWGIIRVEKVIK